MDSTVRICLSLKFFPLNGSISELGICEVRIHFNSKSVSRVWIVLTLGNPLRIKGIKTNPLSGSRVYEFQGRMSMVSNS